MSTGITTWNMNLLDIGAMYPFPGTEMLWAVIGIGSWVIWHIIQIKAENAVCAEEERELSDPVKLGRALQFSNAETLNESMKSHGQAYTAPGAGQPG